LPRLLRQQRGEDQWLGSGAAWRGKSMGHTSKTWEDLWENMGRSWFFWVVVARTILKNDGVKVNGWRMTSLFYDMENKSHVPVTTNQIIFKWKIMGMFIQ
jgi:hypothetical protein